MQNKDFELFLNGARNDFKIAIDDLFDVIEIIQENQKKLKSEIQKIKTGKQ